MTGVERRVGFVLLYLLSLRNTRKKKRSNSAVLLFCQDIIRTKKKYHAKTQRRKGFSTFFFAPLRENNYFRFRRHAKPDKVEEMFDKTAEVFYAGIKRYLKCQCRHGETAVICCGTLWFKPKESKYYDISRFKFIAERHAASTDY